MSRSQASSTSSSAPSWLQEFVSAVTTQANHAREHAARSDHTIEDLMERLDKQELRHQQVVDALQKQVAAAGATPLPGHGRLRAFDRWTKSLVKMALAHVAGKYRVPCSFEFLKFASSYPFPTALYKSDARFAGRHRLRKHAASCRSTETRRWPESRTNAHQHLRHAMHTFNVTVTVSIGSSSVCRKEFTKTFSNTLVRK